MSTLAIRAVEFLRSLDDRGVSDKTVMAVVAILKGDRVGFFTHRRRARLLAQEFNNRLDREGLSSAEKEETCRIVELMVRATLLKDKSVVDELAGLINRRGA